MPLYNEMNAYQNEVTEIYHLREKMVFRTEVQECTWRDDASRWLMKIRDVNTDDIFYHECQILFAATGKLVEPRPCDILNASSFKGAIFHSARWNHDVNLEGKKVAVVGNGCMYIYPTLFAYPVLKGIGTAAQIVPSIVGRTESLTQIVRSKHWIFPMHNFSYPTVLQWILHYVPLAMRLHRFHIFLIAESDFLLFFMNKLATLLRQSKRNHVEKYMRKAAPAKYHDLLVPDFAVGCKVWKKTILRNSSKYHTNESNSVYSVEFSTADISTPYTTKSYSSPTHGFSKLYQTVFSPPMASCLRMSSFWQPGSKPTSSCPTHESRVDTAQASTNTGAGMMGLEHTTARL